jgi:tRNA-2-methylthio-N6-dimethylallyladenosine synthase
VKRYFVHTFGCQMNVNDSLRMGEALATIGYRATPTAEQADLIILNTCAIREKAEDKMLSALGRYRSIKTQRGALLAVGGCVAQQEKGKLLARVPYLDFVFGPDAIGKLPELVTRVVEDRVRVAETAWVDSEEYVFPRADPGSSAGKVSEFVTVMKGCDNVCSFCVVPHTRGREVSRRGARGGGRAHRRGRPRGHAHRAERQLLPGRDLLRRAAPASGAGPGHRAGALHHQPPP